MEQFENENCAQWSLNNSTGWVKDNAPLHVFDGARLFCCSIGKPGDRQHVQRHMSLLCSNSANSFSFVCIVGCSGGGGKIRHTCGFIARRNEHVRFGLTLNSRSLLLRRSDRCLSRLSRVQGSLYQLSYVIPLLVQSVRAAPELLPTT